MLSSVKVKTLQAKKEKEWKRLCCFFFLRTFANVPAFSLLKKNMSGLFRYLKLKLVPQG